MKVIFIIASVAALCGFALFSFLRKKKDIFSLVKLKCNEEIDTLSMAHVIKYFKSPDKLSELRENKNFIAVALKENQTDGSVKVACCMFDKSISEVVDIEKAYCWYAKNLDKDLQDAFGDKPMIVLQ